MSDVAVKPGHVIEPKSPGLKRASANVSPEIGRLQSAISELDGKMRSSALREVDPDCPIVPCLASLVLQLVPTATPVRIVESLPICRGRMTTAALANALANLGYVARRAHLSLQEVDPRLAPCLFIGAEDDELVPGDPIVVMAISDTGKSRKVTAFRPQTGEMLEIDVSKGQSKWNGMVTFYRPMKAEDDLSTPAARKHTGHSWFRANIGRFNRSLWQLVIVGFFLNIVALGTPLFIMLMYDRVVGPRTLEPLNFLVLGVVLSIGMETALRWLRSSCLSWMASRLDFTVGSAIFERLVQLPAQYLERASVSAQVARIKTFESVRDFFSSPVFMSVLELPAILISVLAIGLVGGALALVPLGVAVAYIVLFLALQNRIKSVMKRAASESSVAQQFTLETLEKRATIKSAGLARTWAEKFREISGREQMAQFELNFLGLVGETLAHGLTMTAATLTLGVGATMVWAGSLSTGTLVATMILVWRVLMPLHALCTMIPRFEQIRNSIQQINDLMDVSIEAEVEDGISRLPVLKGGISFSNTGLRYSAEAGPVFLGLNVSVRPGQILGVTGPNGSGKSSVLKLIQGLYKPISGSVHLDGFDVRQLAQREMRRAIAYVPQSPDLFPGTVAENLRIADPFASDEKIMKVLETVGAKADIDALQHGIETVLHNSDHVLSGTALPQKIALARAWLQNSPIVLIDEMPNSVLLEGGFEAMKALIDEYRGSRTVVFVSHRTDLLRLADTVVALRPRQVPAVGSLDSIMALAT
jgi:ATP-binding cassette, subfamily C, bacterial LapB